MNEVLNITEDENLPSKHPQIEVLDTKTPGIIIK